MFFFYFILAEVLAGWPRARLSFIIKTAWLWLVDERKSDQDWRGVNQAYRLLEIFVEIENAFARGELKSRFNPTENILAKLENSVLKERCNYLRAMNNKWRYGNMGAFIREVLPDMYMRQSWQYRGGAPRAEAASSSEERCIVM